MRSDREQLEMILKKKSAVLKAKKMRRMYMCTAFLLVLCVATTVLIVHFASLKKAEGKDLNNGAALDGSDIATNEDKDKEEGKVPCTPDQSFPSSDIVINEDIGSEESNQEAQSEAVTDGTASDNVVAGDDIQNESEQLPDNPFSSSSDSVSAEEPDGVVADKNDSEFSEENSEETLPFEPPASEENSEETLPFEPPASELPTESSPNVEVPTEEILGEESMECSEDTEISESEGTVDCSWLNISTVMYDEVYSISGDSVSDAMLSEFSGLEDVVSHIPNREQLGTAMAWMMHIGGDDIVYHTVLAVKEGEGVEALDNAVCSATGGLFKGMAEADIPYKALDNGLCYCVLSYDTIGWFAADGIGCYYVGSGIGNDEDISLSTKSGIAAYCNLYGDFYVADVPTAY